MLRLILILTILLSPPLTCSAEQVLKEYSQDEFLKAHNKQRSKHNLPILVWSKRLQAEANQTALELSVNCFTNSLGNGIDTNVYQNWKARVYTISRVVKEWSKEDESKALILDKNSKNLGCAYKSCKDVFSYATSVIYVCHFDKEVFVK